METSFLSRFKKAYPHYTPSAGTKDVMAKRFIRENPDWQPSNYKGPGGGRFGGAGAGDSFKGYNYIANDSTYVQPFIPIERTFDSAFREARSRGDDSFIFNNARYTTEMGNNPKNNAAALSRRETIAVPMDTIYLHNVNKRFSDDPITSQSDTINLPLPFATPYNSNVKAYGGFTNGGHFDNGVTKFNTGGSHSENPFGGIMQGIGANGEPNLVEEGEVKWNDYIFSDRINTPKKENDMIKLSKGILDKTFADAALYLSKESEERPNDPISKRGLNDSLSKLAMLQEMNRPVEPDEGGNQFPTGGYLTLGNNNNNRFFNYTPNFMSNNFRTSITKNSLPVYTDEEIMAHAKSVFGDNIETALEVLVGEGVYDWKTGKFNPYAYASNIMSDGVLNEDRGIAQISSRYHPNFLDYYDPIKSLSYMGEITKGGTDFSPYVSYTKGNDAINAYRASKGLPPIGKRQTADTPVVSNQNNKSSNTSAFTPATTPTTLDTDGDRMERWMGLQERIFQRDLDRDAAMAKRDQEMQDLLEKEANRPNIMRYAPLFTNLGILASSYAETPDNLRLGRITPTPVTERLEYRPIDTEYIANQMRQQAAGAARGVIDTAGGNRAMASAGLRSINRSTQDAIGAGLFQGRQYNDALRREVQAFNRDTSIQNAQSDLIAQQFNTQAYNKEQEYRKQSEAALRNMQRQGWAGIGNILGDIGRENRFFRIAPILSGGYNAQGIMGANKEGFGFKDGGFMKFYKRKIK